MMTAEQLKQLTADLCNLCATLYPDEWPGKYSETRENFRDWLNTKTGLNVDQIVDKENALTQWVNKLNGLAA